MRLIKIIRVYLDYMETLWNDIGMIQKSWGRWALTWATCGPHVDSLSAKKICTLYSLDFGLLLLTLPTCGPQVLHAAYK